MESYLTPLVNVGSFTAEFLAQSRMLADKKHSEFLS